MQFASASASSTKASSSPGGDIARLQKQLRKLTEELRGVASSDMDAKAEQERAMHRAHQQQQQEQRQAPEGVAAGATRNP